MAPIKFLELIEADKPIDVYGNGQMRRDFTYVDDLVEGIVRLMELHTGNRKTGRGRRRQGYAFPGRTWRVVNIGNGQPVELMDFIAALEAALGKTAEKNMLPMQKGDVAETFASNALLSALTGYKPSVGVEDGVRRLVEWYRDLQTR